MEGKRVLNLNIGPPQSSYNGAEEMKTGQDEKEREMRGWRKERTERGKDERILAACGKREVAEKKEVRCEKDGGTEETDRRRQKKENERERETCKGG
jgi:hypothetical protein